MILTRKQVEWLHLAGDPIKLDAAATIDAMLPLVEELARHSCFDWQGEGNNTDAHCGGTCPPCKARAFLEEFER